MKNQRSKTDYVKVESIKMLIEKNEQIKKFIMIRGFQRLIENNKTEKGIMKSSDEIIQSYYEHIDRLLDGQKIEDLYKQTAYEYAEITSLLFT